MVSGDYIHKQQFYALAVSIADKRLVTKIKKVHSISVSNAVNKGIIPKGLVSALGTTEGHYPHHTN